MNSSEAIVVFDETSKRFGKIEALSSINVKLNSGSIIGLIGANGCGKSTFIRHIIGLHLPDRGSCKTFGIEAKDLDSEALAKIGYVHQEGELQDWMKVSQQIEFVSCYYKTWNESLVKDYIQSFALPLDSRVGKLSPGQRQQLAVLLAIGHEPDLLILDEPAAGMDPIARMKFLEILVDIIQEPGRTIILSSHILSDIEKVIDHVLIMNAGEIIYDKSLDDLRESYLKVNISASSGDLPDGLDLSPLKVIDSKVDGQSAQFIVEQNDERAIDQIRSRYANCHVEMNSQSLEGIYKAIISQANKS